MVSPLRPRWEGRCEAQTLSRHGWQPRHDALYQGFSILTRRLALEERALADLAIEPRLPEHHDMSRTTLKALVDAGERAATEVLPALRRLLA